MNVLNTGCDFCSLAENSDLFVQVIAHIPAVEVPNSVLQSFKDRPHDLPNPHGGLLVILFLRRLASESVMAAKERISGQVYWTNGVGRNQMVQTR